MHGVTFGDPAPLSDREVDALASGGVVVRDGAVPPARVAAWRDVLGGWAVDGTMTRAGLGAEGRHRPGLRGDLTCLVTDDAALPGAVAWFDALRREVVAATRVALDEVELQAACYPGGGARYVRHVDALRGDPARRITALVYLNPDWARSHGGLLVAWTPDGVRRLAPRAGRLVLFRSDAVEHAVSAARAPRFALTGWMRVDRGW